jgi:hypothetical protein
MENDFIIKIAVIPFRCPKCGTPIKVGENYIENGERKLCIGELPARRLVATGNRRPISKDELETNEAINHLRVQNLKMRLELEVISEDPDGEAAKKIIAKYRKLRKIRNEQFISNQN